MLKWEESFRPGAPACRTIGASSTGHKLVCRRRDRLESTSGPRVVYVLRYSLQDRYVSVPEREQQGRDRIRATHGTVPGRGALAGLWVLIVDDDRDARDILQRWFEYMGAVAMVAGSADEALSVFRRRRPDVVITDIAMPVRDGAWLREKLRGLEWIHQTETPVVAISGFSPRDAGVRASFEDWLAKPVDLAELAWRVRRLTDRRRSRKRRRAAPRHEQG